MRVAPIIYMLGIWLQSGYFNPGEAVETWPIFDGFNQLFSDQTSTTGGMDMTQLFEYGHLVEFGIFYILLMMALATFLRVGSGWEGLAAALAVSYAFIDEWHQSFVPYRSATFIDLVKDFIGIFVAWLMIHFVYVRKHSADWMNERDRQ